MDKSQMSNQTVLMNSVIRCDPDQKKSPRILQKEQYEFFKSQLTELNEKHRESMEHLKERSRQRSARSIERERSRSKEKMTSSQITTIEQKPLQKSVITPVRQSNHQITSSQITIVEQKPLQKSVITPLRQDILTSSQITTLEQQKTPVRQHSPKMSLSDLRSDKTNLTAIMKSHVLSDENNHLKSEENRMRQIINIQNMNQNKLDNIKKGIKNHKYQEEYMTFSKLEQELKLAQSSTKEELLDPQFQNFENHVLEDSIEKTNSHDDSQQVDFKYLEQIQLNQNSVQKNFDRDAFKQKMQENFDNIQYLSKFGKDFQKSRSNSRSASKSLSKSNSISPQPRSVSGGHNRSQDDSRVRKLKSPTKLQKSWLSNTSLEISQNDQPPQQFIFADQESFLRFYPYTNDIEWQLRFELFSQMKPQFDLEVQKFTKQFKHDQMQLVKNEFMQEFRKTLENEKIALQQHYKAQEQDLTTKFENAKLEMEQQIELAYQEQLKISQQEYDDKLAQQTEIIRMECLQTYRNEKEDQITQRLRTKLEKQIRLELEVKIRDEIETQILNSGEFEKKIRVKLQQEFDKKEGQMKRKFKLEMQEKAEELQEILKKEFEHEVRKKSQSIIEKKEIDIQRKYRIQYQQKQQKLEEELKTKYELEMKDMKTALQAEIADLSRLKSAEQIKIKKQNEQQKQLIQELNQQKTEMLNQKKFQEYLTREKQINDELQNQHKMQQQIVKEKQSPIIEQNNLKNDFGALHMFQNKKQPKFEVQEPKYDEPKFDEDSKPAVLLDSQYERDFDQQFMMNKLNFEQVNEELLGQQYFDSKEDEQDYVQSTNEEPMNFYQQEEEQLNFYPQKQEQQDQEFDDVTPQFTREMKQDLMKPQKDLSQKNIIDNLLTTNDKEDLAESIKQLKYEAPKFDSSLTGCISIKDQVLRQLQKQEKQVAEPEPQVLSLVTDLNPYKDKLEIAKIEQYIKNDKNYESILKQMVKEVKEYLLDIIKNDHGMIDYLIEVYHQLQVPFKSRLSYFQAMQFYAQQNNQSQRLSLNLYQKLQDEVDRISDYQSNAAEIFALIKKKEEAFDVKYRATINSQLIIKIEEFRRNARMQKTKKNAKNSIMDIYWRGVPYIEMCKIEKEAKEQSEREKIKNEIQSRKVKTQGLPPGAASKRGRGIQQNMVSSSGSSQQTVQRAILLGQRRQSGQHSSRCSTSQDIQNKPSFQRKSSYQNLKSSPNLNQSSISQSSAYVQALQKFGNYKK